MRKYEFFTTEELKCPCAECNGEMNRSFMERVTNIRRDLDFPFPVSSGFRCPKYNKIVGGAPGSYHQKGQALDIEISGLRAYKIIAACKEHGIRGIGVSQKGNKRFIHIDNRPVFAMWSY